jgi:hypothetical protein
MCNDPLLRLRQNEDFVNEMLNRPFNSYSEFKQREEDTKVLFLIKDKYLKLLGKFIENTYSDLRFDIHIRNRDPKEQKLQWYGHTYMELKVFDIVRTPMYSPDTFEPYYSTPHCKERISSGKLYKEIDDFIPEINKHLLISYRPIIEPQYSNYHMSWSDIPDYECWREYYLHQRRDTHNF